MPTKQADVRRLSRAPLGRQIADVLREDILTGNLKPGQHLTQQEICEQFEVSRMPVRDALLNLTYAGLVVDEGAGRVKVAAFTAQDLEDVYAVEGRLHGVACKRVAAIITPEQLTELERLLDRTVEAVKSDAFVEVDALSWQFHRNINHWSGSTRLTWMMSSVGTAIPRSFVQTLNHWAPKMTDMESSMLSALRDRDGERASMIAEEHTRNTGTDFIAYLRDKGVLKVDS